MNLRAKAERVTITAAAALMLAFLGARPASAQLTPFTQSFCGNWNNANTSQQAGASNILQLHDMNSTGNASPTPCGMGEMDDGSYTWTVRHGTVNTTTQSGTEHGVFSYSGSDPVPNSTLSGIFDGQIFVYTNGATCTGSCSGTDMCTTVIYSSLGNWNSIKNNQNLPTDSTFHSNGTYAATVKQDTSGGPGNGHCAFEADLQPH